SNLFFVLCSVFLFQQNSYVPVAPPDARPTPNPSHIHSNVSAAPATTHSPVPEDVQLAMAINASIQSALAEGVPVPNPQPVNLSTNTMGWAPSENTTTTTYNGWGQSSGAPPPSKVATTSDPFNGWSGVRPSSSSPQLYNSQLETPSVLPSAHEAPPTVTVPSAPPTVTVPSAPPLAEETFYPGPVQYPTIDSSPVDLSMPAAGSKPEPFDPKEDSGSGASSSCVICLDAPVEGACIPCGHMAGCMSCLNEIKGKKWGCPVCRANIDQVIRLYAV
ncbi:probable E3 ubiquitin-protein ligase XBOS34, partial [Asparagus officinalis]|uniref:probable E3 ubiquitin-protein ligase XBOS34 n=1 Tax=Asparagus officinalis TaxID=4686 RepID=UPI00098DFEAE